MQYVKEWPLSRSGCRAGISFNPKTDITIAKNRNTFNRPSVVMIEQNADLAVTDPEESADGLIMRKIGSSLNSPR